VVKITNDLAEQDPENLIFESSMDAKLDISPSRVYSGVVVDYDGGWVYVERDTTTEEFRRRDTTMSAPNVKSAATARKRGQRYLRDLATEEHVISVAILVGPEQLNSARAGQRLLVKFSHLGPFYREWTWLRAIHRTTRELTPEVYELSFQLTTDNPAGGAACPSPTPAGSYWPLGGVTETSTANPSDGVVYYLRAGIFSPIEPTPGHIGSWHFPLFGAGGEGTLDGAGTKVSNRLRFIVVGDGTMSIQTEVIHVNGLIARLYHLDLTAPVHNVLDATYFGDTGDEFVIPISTHGGAHCIHWVDVADDYAGAGGWGWSGMTWETE
jgi:hypothetical protein